MRRQRARHAPPATPSTRPTSATSRGRSTGRASPRRSRGDHARLSTKPSRCSRWTRWSSRIHTRGQAASSTTRSSCSPPTTGSSTASTGCQGQSEGSTRKRSGYRSSSRGPGFRPVTAPEPVVNADLAPTFVDSAVRPLADHGRALAPRSGPGPDPPLRGGPGGRLFTAVRTGRMGLGRVPRWTRESCTTWSPMPISSGASTTIRAGRAPGGAGPGARPAADLQGRGRLLSVVSIAKIIYT